MVSNVHVADMAVPERLQERGDLLDSRRRDEQVRVIGHQDVRVDRATELNADLATIFEIANAVGGVEAARFPIVAALDDMLRHCCEIEPRLAWHAGVASWASCQDGCRDASGQ